MSNVMNHGVKSPNADIVRHLGYAYDEDAGMEYSLAETFPWGYVLAANSDAVGLVSFYSCDNLTHLLDTCTDGLKVTDFHDYE